MVCYVLKLEGAFALLANWHITANMLMSTVMIFHCSQSVYVVQNLLRCMFTFAIDTQFQGQDCFCSIMTTGFIMKITPFNIKTKTEGGNSLNRLQM